MTEIILIGILSAFFTLFINYCLGKPGSKEFSPYEIFSFYSIWLAKRRLKKVGLLWEYHDQFKENEHRNQTKAGLITLRNDFKKILYEAAEPFFTWERGLGMCPVCFGVRVSLLTGIWFIQNVVDLLIIVVISHITIRIINKII